MRRLFILFLCLVILGLVASLVLAQADVLEIPWSTIAGGAGEAAKGNFELVGIVGQSQTGQMSGGEFAVSSGFLEGFAGVKEVGGSGTVYVPLVIKSTVRSG